ncbi:MAG: carbohydrate ABC transporter permease [Caldilineaceae bacterium]|nr:carbohydrate ABC transporter permease [Caldilineaceae bacterium]MCB0143968.1 carbohydrate ABC transporter permease [Caldilineaceae bacterium]MCB9157864.1 carbohydrate ABC transporter permease [Caldilineaceae bacterium]
MSNQSWLRRSLWNHILLWLAVFIILLPILWMVSTSLKDREEFFTNSAALIPGRISFVNYEYLLTSLQELPLYMRNSFILAIGVSVIQVIAASLAGYAFARMNFWGRDLIFISIVVSMFIPRSGGLMALYELMAFLKLRNSLFGLILLFSAGLPIPIFIMRQAFLSIPKEIEESALIDGASWFQIFWRIAFPLASSAMVVIATLAFVGVWSDYLVTYTMIDRDTQLTISVGIQKVLTGSYEAATAVVPHLRGQFAHEAADAAILLFSAFPVILVYGLLQRWFMKGLTDGAIKF